MAAKLTTIVKNYHERFKSILSSDNSVVEKTVALRRISRNIASEYFSLMQYSNINEFYEDYGKGRSPITELEGEGVIVNDIIILKKCPMAPLLEDFKVNGAFPDYWQKLPQEFMSQFKNEAILHPLCIVHQSFRNELAKKIPKGKSYVHSVAVACRSGTGKVVYSEFGLMISGKTKDEVDSLINNMACAFHVR